MKRIPLLLGCVLALSLMSAAACFSEVEREPTATPDILATATVPATSEPTKVAPIDTPSRPEPTATTAPTVNPVTTTPPTLVAQTLELEVRAPRDGSTVRTDAVVVHGVTMPGVQLEIDGVAVEVEPDGRFQSEVLLDPGTNAVRVVATDSDGNDRTIVLNVTSLALPPQPFLLIITEPQDQSIVFEKSIRISGRTGPDAIASINGVSVSVDELGFFFTAVTLEPGPNIIDVVATNNDGRELSTVIAIIYRP